MLFDRDRMKNELAQFEELNSLDLFSLGQLSTASSNLVLLLS